MTDTNTTARNLTFKGPGELTKEMRDAFEKGEKILAPIKDSIIILQDIYMSTNRESWWRPVLNFRIHLLNPTMHGFKILQKPHQEHQDNPGEFLLALSRTSLILSDPRDIAVLIQTRPSRLKIIRERKEEMEKAVQTICSGWARLKSIFSWKVPIGKSKSGKELIEMLSKEMDNAFQTCEIPSDSDSDKKKKEDGTERKNRKKKGISSTEKKTGLASRKRKRIST